MTWALGLLLCGALGASQPEAAAPAAGPLGFGAEVGTGLYGSLSFLEAGVQFPVAFGRARSGVKAVAMSSLTWASFTRLDTGETVSLHPVVLGGVAWLGGQSPLLRGFLRLYGGVEVLLGTTLTPYDSAFYRRPNLIGDNLTFGLFGTFGLEVFGGEKTAFFVEGGGGFKSLKVAQENTFAVAAAWLGSGVTLRVGTRFFF